MLQLSITNMEIVPRKPLTNINEFNSEANILLDKMLIMKNDLEKQYTESKNKLKNFERNAELCFESAIAESNEMLVNLKNRI